MTPACTTARARGLLPLLAVCVAAAPAAAAEPGPGWSLPNRGVANTRVGTGTITARNVAALRIAWKAPLRADSPFYGGMNATPLVLGSRVVFQDMRSDVEARDLRTGRLLWRRRYDDPTVGPNGLASADGVVFGTTVSFVFALDAVTGRELWRSRVLPRNDREGIDMAPGVHRGTVYVSTVPGNYEAFYTGGGAGVLWALDARTGRPRWTFRTVPFGLWGDPAVNSGGGLWHPPGFDGRGGVYIDIGNPGPTNAGGPGNLWATSRPGPNLFTNSIVKLDERTGRRLWHHQVVPHDLYDWDSQLPPVVDNATGRVYIAGKYGRVLAFGQRSGRLLWEVPVGLHNGHDDDNLLAMRGDLARLPALPFTVAPGEAGGVETPMALRDGTLYVPVANVPYVMLADGNSTADLATGTGEMVALDTATGRRRWTRALPTPVFGAATVVNDLVLTTDLGGRVWGLARRSGRVVWRSRLPAQTNAQLVVAGDMLVTAASAPQPGQVPAIVAYRLGARGPAEDPPAIAPAATGGTILDTGGIGVGGAQGGM